MSIRRDLLMRSALLRLPDLTAIRAVAPRMSAPTVQSDPRERSQRATRRTPSSARPRKTTSTAI